MFPAARDIKLINAQMQNIISLKTINSQFMWLSLEISQTGDYDHSQANEVGLVCVWERQNKTDRNFYSKFLWV